MPKQIDECNLLYIKKAVLQILTDMIKNFQTGLDPDILWCRRPLVNIIDMIIVVVTAVFVIRGIFRGLTRELASIVGVVAGFYGALAFSSRAVKLFPEKIAVGTYADVLGFAVVFCGILIAVHVVAFLIRWALGLTMLSWVDRMLGAGFGALKSALVLSVVFFVITRFVHPATPAMKGSVLYGYVTMATEAMAGVVSSGIPDKISSEIKKVRGTLESH
jgi:membrane protein required for colicin V production